MSEPSQKPFLASYQLQKNYKDGTSRIEVLKEITLAINEGERIAIVGPSGSGKSTLLHLLGGLDKPSAGCIRIYGRDWQQYQESEKCRVRNQHLGFVYQFHHLLPEFSALENIAMPLLIGSHTVEQAKKRAQSLLKAVGLESRATHKPAQLSGGERQRVAIARALANNPSGILADEPTGNLDMATAKNIFKILLDLNQSTGTALVIVTHDEHLANQMDRVLVLQNGSLV